MTRRARVTCGCPALSHVRSPLQWRLGFVDAEHRIGVSDSDHTGDWWSSRLVGDLRLTVSRVSLPLPRSSTMPDLLPLHPAGSGDCDSLCYLSRGS